MCRWGCGHKVGGGGDAHRKEFCPPKAGRRSARKSAGHYNMLPSADLATHRGAPVAGTGKPGASSKAKKAAVK